MSDTPANRLTEADMIAACEDLRRRSEDHPRKPAPLLLHPDRYAEWRRRGWINDDRQVDWEKVAHDTAGWKRDGTTNRG